MIFKIRVIKILICIKVYLNYRCIRITDLGCSTEVTNDFKKAQWIITLYFAANSI